MSDDRRMTTDRFFGGVSNRLANLRATLDYIHDEQPSRDELNEWLRENTQARSPNSVDHHLAFLSAIDLLGLSDAPCTLAVYGRRYRSDHDPETLYDALTDGVKGFDAILEALADGPRTDEDVMDLLVREFEEAEMTTPGPAIRHREWLQVLGYVERSDGMNHLTDAGRELLDRLDAPAPEAEADSHQEATAGPDDPGRDPEASRTLEDLRRRAIEASQTSQADETDQPDDRPVETTTREVISYHRSTAVREYVLARADGHCEACDEEAPFVSSTGEPYLHAHHVDELSGGGDDAPENVIALCPNCHYRVHHGRDGEQFNRRLAEQLAEIE